MVFFAIALMAPQDRNVKRKTPPVKKVDELVLLAMGELGPFAPLSLKLLLNKAK